MAPVIWYFNLLKTWRAALACSKIAHQLFLWPYFLSPMRHAPGPPLGHLIYGQWPEIIRNEAGVVQREWAKKYGPRVRALGPIGVERMTFLNPEAMHKILISDSLEYPRVRYLFFALRYVGNSVLTMLSQA